MSKKLFQYSALAALMCVSPAFANEKESPFSAELLLEAQTEQHKHNHSFFRSELAPTVLLGSQFFIDGVMVLEPLRDYDGNHSRFFGHEGAYAEEIKLNYQNGAFGAFAGKFNPAFGIAWDYGRGIWGEDFAEDYEITEKLGFGGSYSFDTETAGTHTITASTFFADTSFLSGSLITKRDRVKKSDGGASNTEDLSSYVVSLDGDNAAGIENLYYKLGYRHLAKGSGDQHHETGYAATLGYKADITSSISMDGLMEYADINHFDASDHDRTYLTTGLITTFNDRWNLTASHTKRSADEADKNDHLLQLSGGYDFGQGTTAEIGYKHTREDGDNSNIVGALVRHSLSF